MTSSKYDLGEVMYLIDLRWLAPWIAFAPLGGKTPPPINNTRLVSKKTGRVKSKARYNHDFRPINGKVWRYLHTLYRGGPTIRLRVPPEVCLSDSELISNFINACDMRKMAEVVQKVRRPKEVGASSGRRGN